MLARAGRPRTAAATSFAAHLDPEPRALDDPGLAKRGVDLDQPPWQKGRYGTAIGRAVHAVLQTVDLVTGDGLEAAAAAQAAAEGVIGREPTITALAQSALATTTVAEAARSAGCWREVFVAQPFGETILEGYLDLLYRTPEGLVVVDYKTDQVDGADALADRAARYRLQLAAYALAVQRVTGERVARAMLVFCSARGPATELEVPDLVAAMADVESRLRATTAGTPPTLLA
jgi:ATP-dependent exoDNAse (exonuclease V) beta subunit